MQEIMDITQRQEIMDIMQQFHPHCAAEDRIDLFSSGALDSLSVVLLVIDINDRLHVDIGAGDITPENFDSIRSICALVERLRDAG